ncbi:LytTR family DNA-binding domain-containing protein [Sphingomonas sp. CFBP 13720]|uniref:LytTR family DNA-binding domain-containing protein n=1 Tax=Sphingomonas sp. CFBP 13720 TaxID=2775302 RepID=UPI0020179191|nr:LytTR family DNA-binding domain-containing protein [Sphingomonas sp. CFBP 13720]
MPNARCLLIDVAILCGIGMLLAVLGPFGSFAAPFARRMVFWVGVVVAGYACYMPATVAASRLADRLNLPRIALWAGACLVATVPLTVIVWAAEAVFRPIALPDMADALAAYGNILVLGSAVTTVFWFRRGGPVRGSPDDDIPADTPSTDTAPVAPAPFLDRLPLHLGRDLVALAMEDHYVRAHTAAGSTLILMRMRDAVAELEGIDGRLVHRSWWVARDHVTGVLRDGRNLRLSLSNGITAPVARGQAEPLHDAGWLQRNATVPKRAAIG